MEESLRVKATSEDGLKIIIHMEDLLVGVHRVMNHLMDSILEAIKDLIRDRDQVEVMSLLLEVLVMVILKEFLMNSLEAEVFLVISLDLEMIMALEEVGILLEWTATHLEEWVVETSNQIWIRKSMNFSVIDPVIIMVWEEVLVVIVPLEEQEEVLSAEQEAVL